MTTKGAEHIDYCGRNSNVISMRMIGHRNLCCILYGLGFVLHKRFLWQQRSIAGCHVLMGLVMWIVQKETFLYFGYFV